ncbi:MAG: hypothetical protein WCP96_11460 [Methylococcaceae bacterium]
MTFNRRLVLLVLSEPTEGTQPPHSAATIMYTLEAAYKYQWTEGLYADMRFVPSKPQLYRTLRELWQGGLIVGSRYKHEGDNGRLPYWEVEYQLSSEVDRNSLLREIDQALIKAGQVHGVFLFTTDCFFREPFDPAPVIVSLKALMHRTHPDKVAGYETEFDQLGKALKYARAKIDLLKTPGKKLNLDR